MTILFLFTFNYNPNTTFEDDILAKTPGVAIALSMNLVVSYISIVAGVYDAKNKTSHGERYAFFGLQLLALVINAVAHMAAVTVEVRDFSGVLMGTLSNSTMKN